MTSTKRLRELLAAATPGPWWINPDAISSNPTSHRSVHQLSPQDAALIAEMRNALPALLDRLDEAKRLMRIHAQCFTCDGTGNICAICRDSGYPPDINAFLENK